MGLRTHEGLLVSRWMWKGCINQKWCAPFGNKTHLRVFIDPDLLQYDEVWAAAGTWNDVFGIEPHKLVEASGGVITDLKRA
ncbi:MAG: hypothetical protein RLZ37_1077 [Actinomycetota bacterium]